MPLGAWNAASWLGASALAFATSTIVVRRLGHADFGIWATLAAFRGFLLFVDGGLALGVSRDVALLRSEGVAARQRLGAATALFVALGAIAFAIGLVCAPLPGALLGLRGALAAEARGATLWVGTEAAMALASAPVFGLLRGRERFDVLALVSGAQAVVGTALLLLAPARWGVGGVAAILAGLRLCSTVAAWLALDQSDRQLLHWSASSGTSLRRVLRFAAPLWVVAAATQVGLGTDVPIVGGFHGPVPAGDYALGSALPLMGIGLLFALLDAYFPRLTSAVGDATERLVQAMVLAGCLLAGLGLGTIALQASDLLSVWVGTAPVLGRRVAAIYSVTWAFNVPVHVLVLVAIARAEHRMTAPFVVAEAAANLLVSVILAPVLPEGPALGTLATLFVCNVLVLPVLILRRLGIAWRPVAAAAAKGYGVGLAASIAITSAAGFYSSSPQVRIAVVLVGTVAGAVLLLGWVFHRPLFTRAALVVFHGGWKVLLRQRDERRRLTPMLAEQRRISPIVWVPESPPLVTVRIATYNRGRLVAERAIASAQAQTHSNLEILVVGDHCDAETEQAVRSVRDPRVRFENLPERGRYPDRAEWRWMVAGAAPMNRALQLAKGDWIAPLDDDDEFTTDHVEALLDACRSGDLEFAYGMAEMEVGGGGWAAVGSWPLRHGSIIHAAVLYASRLRLFLHEIEAWRVNEPGDWNLWARMRRCGVRMGFLEKVVCRHYLEAREFRKSS